MDYEMTRSAKRLASVEVGADREGSARSGIGDVTNRRRAAFASHRARRADCATRALSVAMPVFAYICRYNFEIDLTAGKWSFQQAHAPCEASRPRASGICYCVPALRKRHRMARFAAIDIGSNSIRLKIADTKISGGLPNVDTIESFR